MRGASLNTALMTHPLEITLATSFGTLLPDGFRLQREKSSGVVPSRSQIAIKDAHIFVSSSLNQHRSLSEKLTLPRVDYAQALNSLTLILEGCTGDTPVIHFLAEHAPWLFELSSRVDFPIPILIRGKGIFPRTSPKTPC